MITRDNFETWAERRRGLHDGASGHTRQEIRYKVRKAAERVGVPVPAWATRADASDQARSGWETRRKNTPARRWAPVLTQRQSQKANGQRAAAARVRIQAPSQKPVVNPEPPPTVSVVLDGLLREWRAQKQGRVIGVGPRGVLLLEPEPGAKPLRFPTTDAALEYLTRPA